MKRFHNTVHGNKSRGKPSFASMPPRPEKDPRPDLLDDASQKEGEKKDEKRDDRQKGIIPAGVERASTAIEGVNPLKKKKAD